MLTYRFQGMPVAYGHPAIKEFIHILVFSPKASRKPLAAVDLEAFNPLPLPLIAYACTAVTHFPLPYPLSECHVSQLLHGPRRIQVWNLSQT